MDSVSANTSASALGFIVIFIFFAAWMTHVVHCISNALWILLLAGAIFFPIGIINGLGIWIGIW